MQPLQTLNARLLFPALWALCLAIACSGTGAAAALPPQNAFGFPVVTPVLSDFDFDGDGQPDRTIIRLEGHTYWVEIRLSTRPERTTFSLTRQEAGFGLFVCDIDQDNDKDFVAIPRTFSFEPPAVWLNDGCGRFARVACRRCADLIKMVAPITCQPDGGRNPRGIILPNKPRPFNRVISNPLFAESAAEDFIPAEWPGPSLPLLRSMLIARSPPRSAAPPMIIRQTFCNEC
ncbi:MAG: VCBS repeat-containing protein [Acidobacteria bacterium]|nr:VCBS repeat-containing protein [Acidobacteriota bacterium]MBI3655390.1 VCBS repeat-containing protein [Acidobacteriota bacterium]